jgi:hypothetical protein
MRLRHPDLRSERGAVLVEFAVVVPVLLFFLIGILELSLGFNYLNDTNQIAANGARLAAVNNNAGGDLKTYLAGQATSDELRDGGSDRSPDPMEVCVEYPEGAEVGKPVVVRVSSDFEFWVLGLVPGASGKSYTLNGSATMRLEREPTAIPAGCA